jgi:hypothetical protein
MSSLVLLIYTEFIKYKMRKQAAGNNSNNFKGVIKKTGIFTFIALVVTVMNFTINTLFPDKSKNQNYFLAQDLISCFAGGVIIPFVIAKSNDAMSKFFELRLTFRDALENGNSKLRNFITSILPGNGNQIHPVL